jgi:hypothetical protein
MKKTKTQYPPTVWSKALTRPCPSGKCSHRHIKNTGPCTEPGCACHGTKNKKGGR